MYFNSKMAFAMESRLLAEKVRLCEERRSCEQYLNQLKQIQVNGIAKYWLLETEDNKKFIVDVCSGQVITEGDIISGCRFPTNQIILGFTGYRSTTQNAKRKNIIDFITSGLSSDMILENGRGRYKVIVACTNIKGASKPFYELPTLTRVIELTPYR